jgi:hypothetical protein
VFRELDEDFKEWLEESPEEPLYMVTALHTILPRPEDESKKQLNTVTGATFLSSLLPFGLGYAFGAPMMMSGLHRQKTNFLAPEEEIVAVEYREVELIWTDKSTEDGVGDGHKKKGVNR